MNIEIEHEIKVLNINSDFIEKRIKELGGTQILNDLTTMEWFDITSFPDTLEKYKTDIFKNKIIDQAVKMVYENQKSLRDQGVLLRLRRQGDVFDLTLKQKISGAGSLITTNSELSDIFYTGAAAQKVREELSLCGFSVVAMHEKKRKSYILPIGKEKLRIDLDTWPLIPQYMEIEGNPSLIHEAISLLGVEKNETTNFTGEDFFSKYGVDFFSNLSFNH